MKIRAEVFTKSVILKCKILNLLLVFLSGIGLSAIHGQELYISKTDDKTHPVSQIQEILKQKKIKTIYIFPDYILRDQKDKSKVLIGRDVTSVKLSSPEEIEKFSNLFIKDVQFTVSIPERIPNPTERNTILFITSKENISMEWCLFKLKSGWWFMIKWEKPNNERGEFTSFMKSGDKMGKYIDDLTER
jgi:hypothetical protein